MKIVALSALIALAAVPALAEAVTVDEYYVVRDPDSKHRRQRHLQDADRRRGRH